MDDQIGRVVDALDKKKLRDNTLIVFMSDNGGTRNPMFSGAIADVSKLKIPCDNGPYREGKGTLYEGGTRVVAFANWPGHVQAGTSDGMMHNVDWLPTLLGIAGGSTVKCKPLDGMDMWPMLSEGKPSPRTEIVYNVEPFRAAIREGDWKLIWRTLLPASVDLYNVAEDPSEKVNLATQHPDKVATLQQRANELAAAMAKPLILQTEVKAMLQRIKLPPSLPADLASLNEER